MYRPTTFIILILLFDWSSAYFYSQPSFYQKTIDYNDNNDGSYQFSYETGSKNSNDQAHSFREESRDEYGNVVGKYGYLDPYGQLRIVNYRAGADGYYADGDTGVDQETLRQQRLLYSNDEATQIQQQTWKELGVNDNSLFGGAFSSSAASAAAAAAAASSASASSSSNFGYSSQVPQSTTTTSVQGRDWTTVVGNDQSNVINQQYSSKGSQQQQQKQHKFYDRLVTRPFQAPIATINYNTKQIYSQYELPVVRQYTTASYKTIPGAYYQQQVYQPTTARYQTKSQQFSHRSGALKSPATTFSRFTQQPSTSISSSHFSSSTSAAAAASASSSSAFGSSARLSNFGIKGLQQQPITQQRSARYNSRPGHAKVSFSQGGVQPYQYSYSF